MTSPLPCAACLSSAEVYVEAAGAPIRSYLCRTCAAIYDPDGSADWHELPHPSTQVWAELQSLERLSGLCHSTAELLEVPRVIRKPRACAGCGRMLFRGSRAVVVTGGAGSSRASRTFCEPCARGEYANLPEDPATLAHLEAEAARRAMVRRLSEADSEPIPF